MSTLFKAAGIVLIFNLFSRVLGFLRDVVIAGYFGASGVTDAFMVAYTLPYSVQMVSGMAFMIIMVPAMIKYLINDEEEAGYLLASKVTNVIGLILLTLSVLGIVFANYLVDILAPGFSGQIKELAVKMTVIMLPSIFFMGLGMLFGGILNAKKKFALVALAPALVNLMVILIIVLAGKKSGIYGASIGTLVGFIAYFILHIWGLNRIGFKYKPVFDFKDNEVKGMLLAVIPISMSVAVNQVLLAMNRIFASGLAPGSISALDFANRVINLPLGIFTSAIVTAIFPFLTEEANKENQEVFSNTLNKGIRTCNLFIIPISVGMMILSKPLIKLLFERGEFSPEATAMTAGALFFFSLALPAFSANMVFTRGFYAKNDYKKVLYGGIAIVIINAILSMLLVKETGHLGLAFSNCAAAWIYSIILDRALAKETGGLSLKSSVKPLVKIVVASAIMGGIVILTKNAIVGILGNDMKGTLIQLVASAVVGAVTYFLVLLVLKSEELEEVKAIFRR